MHLVSAPNFVNLPLADKFEALKTYLSEDDRRGMSMTQGNKSANGKYVQFFKKFCNITFGDLLKSVDGMRDNHKPSDRPPIVAFDQLVEQIKGVRDQQKKAHPNHPRAGNFVFAEFECVINPALVDIVRLTHKFFDKASTLTQHVQCVRTAITVVERHYELNESAKSNVVDIRAFLDDSALAATRDRKATAKANMLKKLVSPDPMGEGGAPKFVASLLTGALVLKESAIRALNGVINLPAPTTRNGRQAVVAKVLLACNNATAANVIATSISVPAQRQTLIATMWVVSGGMVEPWDEATATRWKNLLRMKAFHSIYFPSDQCVRIFNEKVTKSGEVKALLRHPLGEDLSAAIDCYIDALTRLGVYTRQAENPKYKKIIEAVADGGDDVGHRLFCSFSGTSSADGQVRAIVNKLFAAVSSADPDNPTAGTAAIKQWRAMCCTMIASVFEGAAEGVDIACAQAGNSAGVMAMHYLNFSQESSKKVSEKVQEAFERFLRVAKLDRYLVDWNKEFRRLSVEFNSRSRAVAALFGPLATERQPAAVAPDPARKFSSPEQRVAFLLILQGYDVVLQGQGGSGKTWLVEYAFDALCGSRTVGVCGTTNFVVERYPSRMKVMTLHAFAGIPYDLRPDYDLDELVALVVANPVAVQRYKKVSLLFIDEPQSLLSFVIDAVLKVRLRIVGYKFQVVYCGDAGQNLAFLSAVQGGRAVAAAHALLELRSFKQAKHIMLTSNMRAGDAEQDLRVSLVDLHHGYPLTERTRDFVCSRAYSLQRDLLTCVRSTRFCDKGLNEDAVALFCKKDRAAAFCEILLGRLDGPLQEYVATNRRGHRLAYLCVRLKVGARVHFTHPLPRLQVTKGARGKISSCGRDAAVVKLASGDRVTVHIMEFDVSGVMARFMPLALSYGVTINSALGLEFTGKILVDVHDYFFKYRTHFYVALSRAKSSSQLSIFGPQSTLEKVLRLPLDPLFVAYYNNIAAVDHFTALEKLVGEDRTATARLGVVPDQDDVDDTDEEDVLFSSPGALDGDSPVPSVPPSPAVSLMSSPVHTSPGSSPASSPARTPANTPPPSPLKKQRTSWLPSSLPHPPEVVSLGAGRGERKGLVVAKYKEWWPEKHRYKVSKHDATLAWLYPDKLVPESVWDMLSANFRGKTTCATDVSSFSLVRGQ